MIASALAFALVLAAVPPAQTEPDTAPPSKAASAATQFVRNFFNAFDHRDIRRIREAFVPTAKIVHDDGVEQTVPELLESVSSAKHWYPRDREIANCEVQKMGLIVIAGCINRVTFNRPDGRQYSTAYDETWVLSRTPGGLKALRTHYSRIRKTSHVE